jgi:hypothetical protein
VPGALRLAPVDERQRWPHKSASVPDVFAATLTDGRVVRAA